MYQELRWGRKILHWIWGSCCDTNIFLTWTYSYYFNNKITSLIWFHFQASLDSIRTFCPKSNSICLNSVLIYNISSDSRGLASQTPHLILYYKYSIRIPRVCLHVTNFRTSKIGLFGQFEVHFEWFAPPLKISPYAYVRTCRSKNAILRVIF